MKSPPVDASPQLVRLSRPVMITAQVTGTAIHVALWAQFWHEPATLWTLFAMFLAATIGNPLMVMLASRVGIERAENLRMAINIAVHAVIGIVTQWTFVSWLFVPFVTTLATAPSTQRAWHRVAFTLVCLSTLALVTGARFWDAVTFTGMSVFVHVITAQYLALANNMIRERDRTLDELRAAQQVAIAQERLASIGQLAAGIAHEINNPMCFVTANTELLLEDLRASSLTPAVLAEYRDEIIPETLDGIKRVNSIVDDIRRFAIGEPERLVPVELSAEVAAVLRMAKTQLGANQCIHQDIAPGLEVEGMRRQLGQVVLNLVVNAIQALGDRGDVHVTLATRNGHVELIVADNGRGMPDEIRQRMFEPFFTTKPPGQGIGLGLAVVHGIVAAHHGTIDVDSQQDRGTRITLRIPASTARATNLLTSPPALRTVQGDQSAGALAAT